MECAKEENKSECNCSYPGCPRKGVCCECLDYHLNRNELPACCFSNKTEKTYDRSFKAFVKDKGL